MKSLSTLIRRRDNLTAKPTDRTAPTPAGAKTPTSTASTVPTPPVGTTAEKAEETDRRSLYEAGTLHTLSEGASLLDRFTNTDDNKWHLVLSGSVRIAWVDSAQSGATTLQEGQWLGPSANAAWSAEAAAPEPCRVLEFGRAAFEQLPAKIQLDAYRSLTETLGDGNRVLRAGRASLEQQVEATRQRLSRKRDCRPQVFRSATGASRTNLISKPLLRVPVAVALLIKRRARTQDTRKRGHLLRKACS